MSNRVSHNDDLFRQKMDDFREMPSDNVWAGVADALDQKKKKRRFVIWFWIGGLGFSASVIAALFFLNPMNETEQLNANNRSRKEIEKNATSRENPSNHHADKNVSTANRNNILENKKEIVSSKSETNTDLNITKSTPKQKNNSAAGAEKIGKNQTSNIRPITPNNDVNTFRPAGTPPIISNQTNSIDNPSTSQQPNEVHSNIATTSTYIKNLDFYPSIDLIGIYDTSIKPMNVTLIGKNLDIHFRATIGVYGYGGGIAYQRNPSNTFTSEPNTITNPSENKNKRFGLYAATAIKAGFIHRTGIYMNLGIGYETQKFTGREQFQSPGITNTPSTVDGLQNSYTNTSFGLVSLPFDIEETQMTPQLLDGKLIYQSHHLFFPIDLGYSFQFKRFGVDLGTSAAFHVPISQKAIFYPEQGKARELKTNIQAAFNFSLGFEPSISYNIVRGFSIMAGGTFRYHLLNTYKDESNVSRPYVLAGNLGLKYTFNRH
jgi:hypothetical protein